MEQIFFLFINFLIAIFYLSELHIRFSFYFNPELQKLQ